MVEPEIIGHRGAAGLCEGNTLESLRRGYQEGVSCLEFDLRRTKDGVLVLSHDPDIVYEGKTYIIANLNQEDIEEIPGLGVRIPTLIQVLGQFLSVKKRPKFLLDVKESGIVRDLCPLLQRWIDRGSYTIGSFILSSFLFKEIVDVHQNFPRYWTAIAMETYDESIDALTYRSPHPPTLILDHGLLSDRVLSTLKVNNRFVWVYTITTVEETRRNKNRWLDGIITDRPDLR